MPAVTVHRTAEIPAARHDVWENLTDHSSWRGWFPGMWRVQPGTLRSGPGATRRVWVGPLRFDEQFDVWNEGRLVYRITGTNVGFLTRGMSEEWTLAERPDATLVGYRINVEPRWQLFILRWLTQALLRLVTRQGLRGLERKHQDRRASRS